MVPGAEGSVCGHSHKAPRRRKSSRAVAYKGVACKAGVNAAARLDIVQRAIRKKGFSGEVAELVAGSIRPGSAKLYNVKWRAFLWLV